MSADAAPTDGPAPRAPIAHDGAMTDLTPDTPDTAPQDRTPPAVEVTRADERVDRPDGPYIGQPAKVMRIGTMVKQLLDEVRSAPLDDAARGRLAEIHERSLHELEDGLSPDLVDELRRIALPFSDDNPSESELRVAQAQLVGWLEGLFHGLQTALVAQQMSTQAQLAQMRRALPPGVQPAGPPTGDAAPGDPTRGTGQYL